MRDINKDFTVHPRKRISSAPLYDRAGRPMPWRLYQVYGSYSQAKQRAWDYCWKLCNKYNGTNFCITSYNSFSFCVAFDFLHPETGEYMTARITPSYNHAYYVA